MSHVTVSASTTHLALSLSASDRDSCNIIMLQTGAIYLAATNIARNTFSVCQYKTRNGDVVYAARIAGRPTVSKLKRALY